MFSIHLKSYFGMFNGAFSSFPKEKKIFFTIYHKMFQLLNLDACNILGKSNILAVQESSLHA